MNEEICLADISQKIRDFLFENYLFGYKEEEFSDDDPFMEFGVLDSLGILELITFMESSFGIQVADEEILPENMDSVNLVSRFIHRKLGSA
jgi:acyl carrier protein